RGGDGFDLPAAQGGTYHLGAGGETTWHEFATAILALDPRRAEHRCRAVHRITTDEYPTPAARPMYSVLDCGRAERELGIRLPGGRRQLELCMEEMAAG